MFVHEITSWDREADVVVIGYGAAGASAAITAAESGASVLILEKQGTEEDPHMSTSHLSGGHFLQPTDRDGSITYLSAISTLGGRGYTPDGGWCDDAIIRTYTDEALLTMDWMRSHDLPEISHLRSGTEHAFEGDDTFVTCAFKGLGLGMMRGFDSLVSRNPNIDVLYAAAATRLVTDFGGRVVGVVATGRADGTRSMTVRAGRGVVMACGGFEFDEQMKLNYLRAYPSYFTGSAACTGDGVRMALEVGAELWHMNCVSARLVMKFPEILHGFSPWYIGRIPTPYIIVNRHGSRYTNEKVKNHTVYYETTLFDSQNLEFPRIPSYWIFDQTRLNSAKLSAAGPSLVETGRYVWSSGNKEELARGWIKTADSLSELSDKLGIEGDYLDKQVESWNGFAASGADPEFNRPEEYVLPLDNPPYCGVPLYPGGPNTQGGPRHNHRGQVIHVSGEPIPGLYAVGELGSMFGMLYSSGGGNLSECFAMGRIVGREVSSVG